jgi:Domain of unknown function (DUF222)
VCDGLGRPASVTEALVMLDRALDCLTAADAGALPAGVQAEALRGLERAQSKHTAARAQILTAFAAQGGFGEDGHGSARTWLKWQARVTTGAAAGAVGWMRRLARHPVISAALAAGEVSESWARQLCEWTDRLPEGTRADADEILTGAARAGADLPGLGGLAQEIYERSHTGGAGDDAAARFDDRALWLGVTFGGAGRLTANLTSGCSAALSAVLEALGKPAGPEDTRTVPQRRHDALMEACKRLVAAGMLPGRAGQPTQVHLYMSLAQLRGSPGASPVETAWLAARSSRFGWLTGPEADAAACDATVVPVVTGHVDWDVLDRLTDVYLATRDPVPARPPARSADPGPGSAAGPSPSTTPGPGRGGTPNPSPSGTSSPGPGPGGGPGNRPAPDPHGGTGGGTPCPSPSRTSSPSTSPVEPAGVQGEAASTRPGSSAGPDRGGGPGNRPAPGPVGGMGSSVGPDLGGGPLSGPASSGPRAVAAADPVGGDARGGGGAPRPLSPATRQRLSRALLALAADALSGPGGLAARLRATLDGRPLTSASLPLDIGAATETIPAHLRRAVTTRHDHCAFPGCDQPASVCDVHHIVPRCRGGPTALPNLVPLCGFHHLTVIHRWGWRLILHADGSTTATSPDGRTLHSHGPPGHKPPGYGPPGYGPPGRAA